MKRKIKNTLCGAAAGIMLATAAVPYNVFALSQDETVYAKLQTNGETKTISVTKHLLNDEKNNELNDLSNLGNIENINGFETWNLNGQKISWQANGKDIYYRGESTDALPVTLNVVYMLDGEEKSLDEMLGKSGKIEIRLKYSNHAQRGNMWTPFVVAVATTLDETKVSNVTVTNGKVTSNGRNVAVAAVTAPGLYESLGLQELKNTDEVVINYETTEFELGDIYSIVTPKLLDGADLKIFNELEELYASADQMSQSSQELVAGAKALKTGIQELRSSVLAVRQKVAAGGGLLDDSAISGIKTQASSAAQANIKAQTPVILDAIKQQVEGNPILMDALKLEAEQLCHTQYGACTPEMVTSFQQQLVAKVEEELVKSSTALAEQVAMQTAAMTAETVAKQLAGVVGEETGALLLAPFDAMVGGIDQILTGADKLSVGMEKFDTEGVQALNNFVNGKVRVAANKIKQLTRLADEYDNFSGKADGIKSETKFVLMIEGKKAK